MQRAWLPHALLILIILSTLAASPGDAGRPRMIESARRHPGHGSDHSASESACRGGERLPWGPTACPCNGPAHLAARRIAPLHSWLHAPAELVQVRVGFLSATLRGGGATTPPLRTKGKKLRGRSGKGTGTRDRMMPYVQDDRGRGSSVSGESSQWALGADVSMASEDGADEFKDGKGGQAASADSGGQKRQLPVRAASQKDAPPEDKR